MDNGGKENAISGLVFFIEVTALYILNYDGNICVINGEENQIKKFKLKEYYEIKNLYYILKNDRNYFLYDITKDTSFKKTNPIISLKNYSIVKFIILDKIIKETNPKIKIIGNPIKQIYQIKEHFQFASILKNCTSNYFLQSFQLIINGNSKSFKFFMYKKQINTINCSLKEDELNNNKSFEVIFLSKKKENLPEEIEISNYKIKDYDIFNCTNRIRFNIMNIKNDRKLDKYNSQVSSLEIIYLVNDNKKKIKYGVFDLNSIKEVFSTDYIVDNSVLNFVNDFWNNYKRNDFKTKPKKIKSYYNEKTNNLQSTGNKDRKFKLLNDKNIIISKYYKNSLDNEEKYLYFRNCFFYWFIYYVIDKFTTLSYPKYVDMFFDLLEQMELNKYSNYDKIRILNEFMHIIFNYDLFPTLLDINTLDEENPYYLAIELQKEIIYHLTEESLIFYPILQFNSKIIKILPDNYLSYLKLKLLSKIIKIKEEYAYTISLEDIEDMKSHLLSLQEPFFFVLETANELSFNGMYNVGNKITTINQYVLCKNINSATSIEEKKDYSFSLNMIFSHERMGHGKEITSNPEIESPIIFFNKNFEKDYILKYEENYAGESGRIFENFISGEILIKVMKKIKKFGKFLNYKYFIKDNEEINKQAILLFQETDICSQVKCKTKIIILKKLIFFIYILVLLLCFKLNVMNLSFNKIIILFLIILLLALSKLMFKDYQKLKEPYKFNDELYDINHNKNEKDEDKLIYPDDYPMKRENFLEAIFPCFQYRKNKIRRKLKKYMLIEKNTYTRF